MGKSLVEEIRRGLTSKQKYIPVWYRYDKDGSVYNDRCLAEDEYYYFDRKEASILKQIAKVRLLFQTNDPVYGTHLKQTKSCVSNE